MLEADMAKDIEKHERALRKSVTLSVRFLATIEEVEFDFSESASY